MTEPLPIVKTCIDTIRCLAMDAVQAANSGHPGTPMALAPVTYELWNHHLRFDPNDPIWPNRDRFVLSAGHASMRGPRKGRSDRDWARSGRWGRIEGGDSRVRR